MQYSRPEFELCTLIPLFIQITIMLYALPPFWLLVISHPVYQPLISGHLHWQASVYLDLNPLFNSWEEDIYIALLINDFQSK